MYFENIYMYIYIHIIYIIYKYEIYTYMCVYSSINNNNT